MRSQTDLLPALTARLAPSAAYQLGRRPMRRMRRTPIAAARRAQAESALRWLRVADSAEARRIARATGGGLLPSLRELARYGWLPALGHLAVEVGDAETAQRAAAALAHRAEEFLLHPATSPSADILRDALAYRTAFYSTMIQGRLALRAGDVVAAARDLFAALRAPRARILAESGPYMALAQDLLLADRKETVLEFLRECRGFWRTDDGRLTRWMDEIGRGFVPYLAARDEWPRVNSRAPEP